jgi:hypothetical protein
VTVYVDAMRAQFGRMKLSHMWADTLSELLIMADAVGVRRRWLQRPAFLALGTPHPLYADDERYAVGMDASWVHFDIAEAKRQLAIVHGAVETDKYGPSYHVALLNIASGVPSLVDFGQQRKAQIDGLRARPK